MKKEKKISGIRTKLLVVLIPIVAVAFAILITIAYQFSKNSIREKTGELMEAEGTTCIYEIESWQNKTLTTLETAIASMEYLEMSDDEILDYEAAFLGTYDDFPNGIYISYDNAKVLDASGWEPENPANESSWYLEGVEHPDFAFGEPYVDDLTGEYVVTATKWIDDLNGKGAVAAADVSLSILSDVVSNMEVTGDGDAFILDTSSGVILANADGTLAGTAVEDCEDSFYTAINDAILAGNTEDAVFSSSEGNYMVNIQNVEGTSWYLVSRGLEKNIYSDIGILQMVLIVLGVVVLAIICILMITLINRITRPILKLTNTIATITEGDFTADIEVTGNDEVAMMAQYMEKFVQAMRGTIGNIRSISENLEEKAKNSSNVSGDLHESANGQSDAMGQLNDTLDELVDSIGVIAENATTLAQTVSNTSESGEMVLEDIERTMQNASEGKGSMESVTTSMSDVQTGMEALEDSISAVGNAAVKINEITSTIRGIADETNLLALNASIEAARAGEAGKGFSVVATQIKSLAETSGKAADEITGLIHSVTVLIQDTVERSQKSMGQIVNSVDLVDHASVQFNSIYSSIEEMSDLVNQMIGEIHAMNDVATNMAAITEEQSASAEEIEATAVSIRELADHVTEKSADVKTDSVELEDAAESLKEKISGFTIS